MKTLDLPLYPWPFPLLAQLRSAKSGMALDFMVRPRPAKYGTGRVLCSVTPNFICDYALVRGDNMEDWGWAIRWVTDTAVGDSRAGGAEELLSEWSKGKVREVRA